MNTVLWRAAEDTLHENTIVADRINIMDRVSEDTYETAPLSAIPESPLSEEDLHTLFETAINGRLLAMREQIQRISGPLSPLPERVTTRFETEESPIIMVPVQRDPLFCGSWRKILLFGSIGLMLATLGFDIMGLIVLYAR